MTRRVTLPELPLEAWEPTRNTLQLYCQIIGKVKLAAAHPANHWWQVPLYPDASGLTTRLVHHDGVHFAIDLHLVESAVVVRTSEARRSFALRDGLSVAEFDRRLHEALDALGIAVRILEKPFATPISKIPFPEDREHRSFDAERARAFWRALLFADDVFQEFSGWFCGKQSPVHLFWHSFDLAVTRFSGRPAVAAQAADGVTREAYSHEVISFGFWPGDPQVREAMFYSYTAPEPKDLTSGALSPSVARWQTAPSGSMALLPYAHVQRSSAPREELLAFLESAYQAGVSAAGWASADFVSSYCPTPGELARLLESHHGRTT